MPQLSLNVPQDFYNRLIKITKKMGCRNLSDGTRVLLNRAMDNFASSEADSNIPHKQLQYIAGTYYLLNEYIVSLGDNGSHINQKAHTKAEQVVAQLINTNNSNDLL